MRFRRVTHFLAVTLLPWLDLAQGFHAELLSAPEFGATLGAMKDLENEADVRQLVDTFYGKIQQDALLNPIFSEVAKVDWSHHLPKMYAFWNGILLGIPGYAGQPFPPHVKLPVTAEHFDRWVSLFKATVDENFTGPGALRAKNAASSISHTFALRMGLIEMPPGRIL